MVAAVLATGIGLAAISLLSGGLTDRASSPLGDDVVPHDARSTPHGASPGRDGGAATVGHRHWTRSFDSAGGTVIARCTKQGSYLVSWSPARGWSVDEHKRGPARSTMVKFEGEDDDLDDREITVTVTCRSGRPVAAVVPSDD